MPRPFLILVALLLLAACTPPGASAPFTDSRAPPSLTPRFYPPRGWAWGLVQVGQAAPQRYGVAAPAGVIRAQVLILPDYGETAEGWFETADDLIDRGYAVWILEGAGQGGSGRAGVARDLGHVASFDPDVASLKAMTESVIPRTERSPLVVVGQGLGGVVALRAAEQQLPVDGLILSRPRLDLAGEAPPWLLRIGLGGFRAPGAAGWQRDAPTPAGELVDPGRWANQQAWMLANPDLRMGGPSLAWIAARNALVRRASAERETARQPILWLDHGPEPHMARDRIREPWIAALAAFIDARIADKRAH